MRESDPAQLNAKQYAELTLGACALGMLGLQGLLNKHGLNIQQALVLQLLVHEKFLSMGGLAKRTRQSPAATSGLIKRLERLGYVNRYSSLEDKRRVFVRPSSKAQSLVGSMARNLQAYYSQRPGNPSGKNQSKSPGK